MSVEGFLFALIAGLLALMFHAGFASRGGYLGVPFLFAVVVAGWVVPQLVSLHQQGRAPGGSIAILQSMSLLCLAAAWAGWQAALRGRADWLGRWLVRVDDCAAHRPVVALTAIAIVGFSGLGFNPAEGQESQWTGSATIYYFLLNLKSASLALSLILFLRQRSALALTLVAANLFLYFPYVVLMFKRRQIAELTLVAAYAVFVMRNWTIPRLGVIAGFLAASVAVFAAAEIRHATAANDGIPTWSEIRKIDFLAVNPLSDADTPEMTNAAYLVYVAALRGDYSLGRQLWNRLVFHFVPGQIVGMDVKQGLMVDWFAEQHIYNATGYVGRNGATFTGFATAFAEFWYFGCMYFFVAAYILGYFWKRAFAGNLWDKGWYAAAMVPGFLMITMHAQYFFVSFLAYYGFMTITGWTLRSRLMTPRPVLPAVRWPARS
jgi:hypothetical protein